MVDKVALGRVISEYFVSLANFHSIGCPTFINHHRRYGLDIAWSLNNRLKNIMYDQSSD
jgi:hypothetical protein